MKKRKTEITIETFEVMAISRRNSLSRRWCASCEKQVAIVNLDDPAILGSTREAIRQQVKTGRVHLIGTADGSPFICLDSVG